MTVLCIGGAGRWSAPRRPRDGWAVSDRNSKSWSSWCASAAGFRWLWSNRWQGDSPTSPPRDTRGDEQETGDGEDLRADLQLYGWSL